MRRAAPADSPVTASASTRVLFTAAVLLSAVLVFSVQPLLGRLLLPLLGGAPAVWNVSLAVFQAALLAGYAYAHLLQRLPSLKAQAATHLSLLALAGLSLPLGVADASGDPTAGAPALWLTGALVLAVGAPFAALSATAPLLQAWFARSQPGLKPWGLYVASNVGSLAALIAYPLLIEPLATLDLQRHGWTVGYGLFVALAALLAVRLWRGADAGQTRLAHAGPVTWRRRGKWLLLAAAPSSLLLGVTTHLATDVASAPFLWIPPLALYLVSFIIAFQARPWIGRRTALVLQAAFVPGAAALLPFATIVWPVLAASQLLAFFAVALVCHQVLTASRPAPGRLTEFYLWIALGGVLGGAFNAFAGPALFDRVWEYPLVLVLAGLARPWPVRRPAVFLWGLLALTAAAAAFVALSPSGAAPDPVVRIALAAACAGAFVLGRNALMFTAGLACVFLGAETLSDREGFRHAERSFFGVHRIADQDDLELGRVRTLVNGTTLHGAQALSPALRCRPITYYAPATPIGQAFGAMQRARSRMDIGVVGLGSGSVVTYARPADTLRFYEIDPMVAALSGPGGWFTFRQQCARAAHDVVLGDARLTLRREPDARFDLLLVDAFSSDTVPTHLLTREAMADYLRVLKPDGVLVLHLSNRNLALAPFAAAAARSAGGAAAIQLHYRDPRASQLAESSSEVMTVARTEEALATVTAAGGWTIPPADAQPWTDQRAAVVEALWRRLREGG